MRKSTSRSTSRPASRLPFGRGSGTVTIIEQPVMRSYIRKAKIVFLVTWAAVTWLTGMVLASKWQPRLGEPGAAIAALVTGGLSGFAVAFIIAVIVSVWPVLRAIWWWLPELGVTGAVFTGWVELAVHTTTVIGAIIAAVIAGVLTVVRPVRRGVSAVAWCLVSRHRVRTCFNEFIIANRTGSLPLILGARPTPAGERLWIWLRPGLCLADVQDKADEIAAACWATAVVADLASASNSALLRIDIKRRDPLTGTVGSPLAQLLSGVIPGRRLTAAPDPVALDLPDIDPADVSGTDRTGRPSWPEQPRRRPKEPAAAPGNDEEDVNDWI